jgi:hypothetical protein
MSELLETVGDGLIYSSNTFIELKNTMILRKSYEELLEILLETILPMQ